MVLLGYNHLTTIATTDALAPLHFPKPTATYVTLPVFQLVETSVKNYTFYIVTPLTICSQIFLPWLAWWLLMAWHMFAA